MGNIIKLRGGGLSISQKIARELRQIASLKFSTRRLKSFIRRNVYGMSRQQAEQAERQQEFRNYLSRVVVDSNQKVHCGHLQHPISMGCTLRCQGCVTHSHLRSGFVPKEEVLASIRGWRQRVVPSVVNIIGGEPLLHPDVLEIAAEAAACYAESQVTISTNGTLFSKRIDDMSLRFLKEHRISVGISAHINTPEYNEILRDAVAKFEKYQISYTVFDFTTQASWHALYTVNDASVPIPAGRSPIKAMNNCGGGSCSVAVGDKLYRCTLLANSLLAYQEGALGSEWSPLLAHKPMTLTSSPQEILDYLRGGPMPECSMCPEEWVDLEPRQLTAAEVQQMKESVQQKRKVA